MNLYIQAMKMYKFIDGCFRKEWIGAIHFLLIYLVIISWQSSEHRAPRCASVRGTSMKTTWRSQANHVAYTYFSHHASLWHGGPEPPLPLKHHPTHFPQQLMPLHLLQWQCRCYQPSSRQCSLVKNIDPKFGRLNVDQWLLKTRQEAALNHP